MRGATTRRAAAPSIPTFQSTRPMRGATAFGSLIFVDLRFQSTRPMRGATAGCGRQGRHRPISIHAPHAGRDFTMLISNRSTLHFNPRAPCGARRQIDNRACEFWTFQSTRPMRGATGSGRRRGGAARISIHAPHAGRDGKSMNLTAARELFQSTRPMRGATRLDSVKRSRLSFQSTRPMRGATPVPRADGQRQAISIHAPHAGRDSMRSCRRLSRWSFQSTRPMRGATGQIDNRACEFWTFQSTRPMRGATISSVTGAST